LNFKALSTKIAQNHKPIFLMNQLSLFDAEEFYNFPKDLIEYKQHFLTQEEADRLLNELLNTTPWQQRSQRMYDRMVLTPRLTAWYGDKNKSHQSQENESVINIWTSSLIDLKQKIEKTFRYEFNSVLLNLYRDEHDSVAWHRDKDTRYGTLPVIASVSLGQTRNFEFRKSDHHQSKYSLPLPHGSLLIMKGDLQEKWEHRIAKSPVVMKERVNLTFRYIR
jgi:alkylated DNA repair dioxygenase AlkB